MASGTVYNYFSSKDMLIAAYMLEDWELCLAELGRETETAADSDGVLRCVYDALTGFINGHRALFDDADARTAYTISFGERHTQMRGQISALLLPRLDPDAHHDPNFTADFLAEALLKWTSEGVAFDTLRPLLGSIYTNTKGDTP